MSVSLSLDGKTALVTGGSRGIGAETVRLFIQAGARVAFNFRQARDSALALAAECGGPAPRVDNCVAIEQELSAPTDGRALVEKAVAALGRLDILVVNHGIWKPNDVPIAKMAEAQWRETLSVNLDSVFGLVKAAAAQMEAQAAAGQMAAARGHAPDSGAGNGHIVLISSTAGQRGEAFHADYAASKGAIISLTKSLSSELAPRGIRVNCVAPGWVDTEMSAPALAREDAKAKIASAIPLGRVATPREIAGPVLFLCTPLAGFISGEVLNVNGGSVLVG
jgi:3-oxoacyl-[acyl-carrier protein] reductase